MTMMNMISTASRTGIQSAWMIWEGIFDQITKLRSISVTQYGICKLVIKKHRGRTMTCADGCMIHAGDWVGELHLDNRMVLELSRTNGPERTALMTARMLRKSLEQISNEAEHNPELRTLQALSGITLLHRGIIHGLGFELHPIKSKWLRRWMTFYLRFLLRVLNPVGKQRVKQNTAKLVPMMLLMSRESLIHRYRKEVML
ncbi:YkoP family protein [Paenibacillus pini]|uniref:Polysaccharide deacetylase n=1 Tax=Paenibacillus pini JCM 16418 TaxID=1236976 RepID=W7Z1C7_9BACL|nr:polysaccharide deacetylase [Paenibacillus pini]GAF08159.1 polysaccharide deacetylase [Paenibacillus pini JCM 16418]